MIVGKHSWKGLLLWLYVALTIVESIGCFLAGYTFFIVVGIALLLCNGWVAWQIYRTLQNLSK
jgi:hypothetical protein